MEEAWEPLVQSDQSGQASNHAEAAERAAETAKENTETKHKPGKA